MYGWHAVNIHILGWYAGNKIFMFGGLTPNEEEIPVATDELVMFEANSPNDLQCTVNPAVSGNKPAARCYALFQLFSDGHLFLYGGLDANSKLMASCDNDLIGE